MSERFGLKKSLLLLLFYGAASPVGAQTPQMSWNVFSSAEFVVHESGSPSAFQIGAVDLFFRGNVTDRIRVVSENVLELDNGTMVFDLERIYVEFEPFNRFRISAGRTHLPLGYYSTAFHHGTLFQLTTHRPRLLRFEDDDGILPAHSVGLGISYAQNVTAGLQLDWTLSIGNGRGAESKEVLTNYDLNDFKSIVGRCGLELDSIPGLETGLSFFWDRISSASRGPNTLSEDYDEMIAGLYIAYRDYPWDVILEAYWLQHTGVTTGTHRAIFGGFLQIGYEIIDRLVPYTRFEFVQSGSNFEYFENNAAANKYSEFVAGIRYRLASTAVIKLEYELDIVSKKSTGLLQAAFGI
jgi:hypothetical protein